jgi:dihydrofolate synthase/folylpolyglutamate synthase
MNYSEALEFIHGVSWTFCKPGLERIRELCRLIGNPERDLKFIHVAGTNGKGSFCLMCSSVLREAGYRTGLYTSPYVLRFNERMQIDGVPISDARLCELCERLKPAVEKMTDKPTEFELITAIALLYFKEEMVDVVVFEVGMGGRLDATNVISTSLISVITGIALDHVAYLGDTVEKIAAEKAGIIKHAPALYGGDDEIAGAVIEAAAKENGAPFYRVNYENLSVRSANLSGSKFDYESFSDVYISLLGLYQPRNAAVVIRAFEILNSVGFSVTKEAVYRGLSKAVWPARFEILSKNPLFIFDGAHNAQGVLASVESIKHYFKDKVHVISGVLKDKDYKLIASKISEVADFVTTITPGNPRALSGGEYAKLYRSLGVMAEEKESILEALKTASERAKADGRALICLGSLYTYADVIDGLKILKRRNEK